MKKIEISRKHSAKKLTKEQENIVEDIKGAKKFNSWLEAKHEYFERQEYYDDLNAKAEKVMEAKPELPQLGEIMAQKTPEPVKRKIMTIAETKLGVTLVLTKEECEKIGIPGTTMTREAIKAIKAKLGVA